MKIQYCTILKSSPKEWKYGSEKNITDLLNNGQYKESGVYECITLDKNIYVKPYFDIDLKREDYDNFDELKEQKRKLKNEAIEYLNPFFGSTKADWAISESEYDDKISYHLVLSTVQVLYTRLQMFKDIHVKEFKDHCIDTVVYGKSQRFRMVLTSKEGKNSPLKLLTFKENIASHFITNVSDKQFISSIKLNEETVDEIIKQKEERIKQQKENEERQKQEHKINMTKEKQEQKINMAKEKQEQKINMAKEKEEYKKKSANENLKESIKNYVQNTRYELETTTDHLKEVSKLLELINIKRFSDYHEWLVIGWTLYNIDPSYIYLWDKYSQTSNKYKAGECLYYWNNMAQKKGYTIKTLYYFAKIDNYEGYSEMQNNMHNSAMTASFSGLDMDIVYYIKEILKDEFIYNSGGWFYFNGVRWIKDKEGCRIPHSIKKNIINLYKSRIQYYYDLFENGKIKEEQYNDYITSIQGVIHSLKDGKTLERLKVLLKGVLIDDDFLDDIDNNPFLLGFNDGVFDLEINTFRCALPSDCITKTTGYSFKNEIENITDKQIKEFDDKIFNKIFTNEEKRQYMLDLYSSCLNGNALQSFNLQSGKNASGGNGKSLMSNLMINAIGRDCENGYGCEFNVGLLTQTSSKSCSANPELAKLKSIRYAVCSEPEANSYLNSGIIKMLTGGNSVSCRALFQNNNSFTPNFTLFLDCNKKPPFDSIGENDGGIMRRMRVCDFSSRFVEEEKDIKDENTFLQDPDILINLKYYSKIFLKKLLNNYKLLNEKNNNKPFVIHASPIIINETKQYFEDSNPFLKWLDNNIIESSDVKVYISLKSLYDEWVNSQEYKLVKACGKYKRNEIIQMLLNSKYNKYFYYEGNKNTPTVRHPITKNFNIIGFHSFDNEDENEYNFPCEDPLEYGINK